MYEHACTRKVSEGKIIMCSAAAEEGCTTSTNLILLSQPKLVEWFHDFLNFSFLSPIIPTLFSVWRHPYYSQNYGGIIGSGLLRTQQIRRTRDKSYSIMFNYILIINQTKRFMQQVIMEV